LSNHQAVLKIAAKKKSNDELEDINEGDLKDLETEDINEGLETEDHKDEKSEIKLDD